MTLNNLNNSNDLRSKLERPRMKKQFHEPIQVVVVNTHPIQSKRNNSDAMRQHDRHVVRETQSSEKEEGEWQGSEDENGQEEIEEEEEKEKQTHEQHVFIEEAEEDEKEEEEEETEHKEDEDSSGEENNDVPAREVQGPQGSVIKVVPPKPRIASTVWARLNVKSEVSNNSYLRTR